MLVYQRVCIIFSSSSSTAPPTKIVIVDIPCGLPCFQSRQNKKQAGLPWNIDIDHSCHVSELFQHRESRHCKKMVLWALFYPCCTTYAILCLPGPSINLQFATEFTASHTNLPAGTYPLRCPTHWAEEHHEGNTLWQNMEAFFGYQAPSPNVFGERNRDPSCSTFVDTGLHRSIGNICRLRLIGAHCTTWAPRIPRNTYHPTMCLMAPNKTFGPWYNRIFAVSKLRSTCVDTCFYFRCGVDVKGQVYLHLSHATRLYIGWSGFASLCP